MPEGEDRPTTCHTFMLTFSNHCIPFGLPTYPQVASIAKLHFKDAAMNVDWKEDRGDKFYIMELTKPAPIDQAINFKIGGKSYDIELHPWIRESRQRGGRQEKDSY